MDLKEIKQLLRLMDEHGLTEFVLERKDAKLSLKRGADERAPASMAAAPAPGMFPLPPAPSAPPASIPAAPPAPAAPPPLEDDKLADIKSPMVGTFYAAPSPDSEPYVQPGAHVGPDTTVCIIEAMKIMNEIKADVSGTIAHVCVKNGQQVEFGQTLFKVRLS